MLFFFGVFENTFFLFLLPDRENKVGICVRETKKNTSFLVRAINNKSVGAVSEKAAR